jgi:hypothetical protein
MTDPAGKEPLFVHCGKCSHEWAIAFMPMPASVFAKLAKSRCPMCGGKKVFFGRLAKPTAEGDAIGWLENGDTGTSSEAIWSVMMGRSARARESSGDNVPRGPDDFGRCYRLQSHTGLARAAPRGGRTLVVGPMNGDPYPAHGDGHRRDACRDQRRHCHRRSCAPGRAAVGPDAREVTPISHRPQNSSTAFLTRPITTRPPGLGNTVGTLSPIGIASSRSGPSSFR